MVVVKTIDPRVPLFPFVYRHVYSPAQPVRGFTLSEAPGQAMVTGVSPPVHAFIFIAHEGFSMFPLSASYAGRFFIGFR